jgi:nitrile hydratase alpha subunit
VSGDTHHQAPVPPVEKRVAALQALLTERGLVTEEFIEEITRRYESEIGPRNGAKVVARAWTDPAYKQRLLADGTAAIAELGFSGPEGDHMVVVENTASAHNVIVCTLCSCYPRPILGNSPEWYRTPNYRRRIVRWPRQVLAEFGLILPAEVEIRVEDSNQKHRFMVMPVRPDGTQGWTEDQLVEIVTRDCLIGVALPKPGVTTNAVTQTRPAVHPVGD